MKLHTSRTDEATVAAGGGASLAWFLVPLLAAIGSLWPTFLDLSHRWNVDSGGSHGWLIGPVCLWLIWLAWQDHRSLEPRPSLLAATMLLAAVVGTLFMRMASIQVLEYAGAVAVVWLALTTVLGWRWGWLLAFPVGYFLFAVPIWDVTTPLLQRMTVMANGVMISVAGMPAYIYGDFVDVPSGTFHIERGCAGSHYFITAMALAALYCHLNYRRWKPRLLLLAGMALMAIVGNWIRVFMVIYAGYVTEMQHPWVTEDHYTLGWVIFGISLVPFFVLGRWLERFDGGAAATTASAPAADAGFHLTARAATVLAVVLAVAPPLAVRAIGAPSTGTGPLRLPDGAVGWSLQPDAGSPVRPAGWRPAFAGATAEAEGAYAAASGEVSVYLNAYASQRQGAELIGYSARPQGVDFEPMAESRVEIGGYRWRLIEATGRGGRTRLVAVRYLIAGHAVGGGFEAKLRQGLGGLLGRTDGAAIVASTACDQDCAAAAKTLEAFITDMNGSLQAAVEAARDGTQQGS